VGYCVTEILSFAEASRLDLRDDEMLVESTRERVLCVEGLVFAQPLRAALSSGIIATTITDEGAKPESERT
jgi:hypothetical protein